MKDDFIIKRQTFGRGNRTDQFAAIRDVFPQSGELIFFAVRAKANRLLGFSQKFG
jgi:hypothetical protein